MWLSENTTVFGLGNSATCGKNKNDNNNNILPQYITHSLKKNLPKDLFK